MPSINDIKFDDVKSFEKSYNQVADAILQMSKDKDYKGFFGFKKAPTSQEIRSECLKYLRILHPDKIQHKMSNITAEHKEMLGKLFNAVQMINVENEENEKEGLGNLGIFTQGNDISGNAKDLLRRFQAQQGQSVKEKELPEATKSHKRKSTSEIIGRGINAYFEITPEEMSEICINHTYDAKLAMLSTLKRQDYINILNSLINDGYDIDKPGLDGNCMLHLATDVAAKTGNRTLMDVLLSNYHCDPNVRNAERKTPLHIAAENYHSGIYSYNASPISLLMQHGADEKLQDVRNQTYIGNLNHDIRNKITHDSMQYVQVKPKKMSAPNSTVPSQAVPKVTATTLLTKLAGYPPEILADAINKHKLDALITMLPNSRDVVDVINFLIQNGYDINQPGPDGNCLLHLATQLAVKKKNEFLLTTILANFPCNVNVINANQETPLYIAIGKLDDYSVKTYKQSPASTLMVYGADPHAGNDSPLKLVHRIITSIGPNAQFVNLRNLIEDQHHEFQLNMAKRFKKS